MNIQQLTYIVEIANCKSISRAAEYLFVSQPALSQQIRNLEKELGYRVFHRTSKGLELTEKGNVFYQKAQEMLKDWNCFKEEVISGTEHKKSDLVPESIPTDCFRRLPDILKGIRSLR